MKKIFLLLFLSFATSGFSQSIFEAKQTNDRAVVERFIVKNPNHPAIPQLKQRLLSLKYNRSPQVAKPTIVKMTEKRIEKTAIIGTAAANGQNSGQAKNTAAVLTNLFNNDPNKKEVIVQFVNHSKCELIIKIGGKKFYNLTVPANGQNYILLDKGTYSITTAICDAIYNQNKTINSNIIISLKGKP